MNKESVTTTSKIYVSKELKDWREAKGYTQSEMAGLLTIAADKEISLSLYLKLEQGSISITAEWAVAISRFTKIDLKDLVVRK